MPLIPGGVLRLPKDQVAILIKADLFACGLFTSIQSIGFRGLGIIRLPVMMGVTRQGAPCWMNKCCRPNGSNFKSGSFSFTGSTGWSVIGLFLARY